MLYVCAAATASRSRLGRSAGRWWAARTRSIRHSVAALTVAALAEVGSRLAPTQGSGTRLPVAELAPGAPADISNAATSAALTLSRICKLRDRVQESLQKQETIARPRAGRPKMRAGAGRVGFSHPARTAPAPSGTIYPSGDLGGSSNGRT